MLSVLHETIQLTEAGGKLVTYILDASDQIQIGKKHPFVIICPGGAYLRTSDQEAEQVALRFAALGCHAAVLRYSCGADILKGVKKGGLPNPLQEIGRAIALCRDNAEKWNVDPNRIIVNGYSAGGHLCALACTQYGTIAQSIGRQPNEIRPNAAILGYPCIDLLADMLPCPINGFTVGEIDPADPGASVYPLFKPAFKMVDGQPRMDFRQAMLRVFFGTDTPDEAELREYSPNLHVSSNTPPTFVWATANDDLVPASNALKYVHALWEHRVPCEFHMFGDGHHGLSLADETVADSADMVNPEVARWFGLAKAWLKHNGLIESGSMIG